MSSYADFLKSKLITAPPTGFVVSRDSLPANLYDYQKDLVLWALARGKAALFTMTGTGKTAMQVSWAYQVVRHTVGATVLILSPLAVSKQTIRESLKFGIHVHLCRSSADVKSGVNITNYEMLHNFDPNDFNGIVLDESSIIKNQSGKMRAAITEFAKNIPYRLACTATPAPNDFMELGTHAEFLGIMNFTEMLATFFVHDGGDTSKWRLKGHAQDSFWKWLASWSVFLTKPSDLNYSDEGFNLPKLHTHQHIVESDAPEGALFAFEAHGLQERQAARRESLDRRVAKCAEIVKQSPKPFMVWCGLNAESESLKQAIPGSIEIKGSDTDQHKEKTMLDFADGKIEVLISKSSICGFGMNWQVCCNTAFVGMSDSFESLFQSTKRFHRHGQKNEVHRHLIISEAEGSVLSNVQRKEADFMRMIGEMVEHTKVMSIENVKQLSNQKINYSPAQKIKIPAWLQEGGY
jgi:superfamily II DNA or RNA helicase